MSDLRYIVMAAGRRSRPVSLEQILEMCAAGKISPDATVASEGSTLHQPILVFLGESQRPTPAVSHSEAADFAASPDSGKSPRSWWKTVAALLLLLWLSWNGWTVYQLHRQLDDQRDLVINELGGLQKAVAEIAAEKNRPAPVQQADAGQQPDPLAGRPMAEQQEILKIVSAFEEYNTLLQQLSNEGQGNSPAARGAEETIQKLMEKLNGFGIPGPSKTSRSRPSFSENP